MAKQASQEGHIFCVQHFPWSRVSAHVTQEDSNAGDHHHHHMMLSEPPVGSDVSHAMGLAALIFKLSMERLSLCLASCPSRAHAKGTSQWCLQRGPHSLSLCSDSLNHQAPSLPRGVTLTPSHSRLSGTLRRFISP